MISDERSQPIDVVDPRRDMLMAAARKQEANPTTFIEDPSVFSDLAQSPTFVHAHVDALTRIHDQGVRAALHDLTRRQP